MQYHQEYESVTNIGFMLTLASLYLTTVVFLRNFMKNRPAVRIPSWLLQTYNMSQIFINTYIFYKFSIGMSIYNIFRLGEPYNKELELAILLHYLSKAYDFTDTFIILLRKSDKQLSFLHVYHHVATFLSWGYAIHVITTKTASVSYPGWINSLVHVIMYTHYFLSSLGINNPFKKYITTLQITQFYTMLLHGYVSYRYDPMYPIETLIIQIPAVISVLILFSNYYVKAYNKSSRIEQNVDS